MAERFILLRGTAAGPVFLVRCDHPDDVETWTEDRADARRFDSRAEAEAARVDAMVRGVAVAVVPAEG